MKIHTIRYCLLAALALISVQSILAQNGLPAAQPKLLVIYREEVKVGLTADHAKNEAGWPAAFEKAKFPYYYLALVSMTGPSEAWYLNSFDSHAAVADSMKLEDKDPVLTAEEARLALRDAEYISSSREIQAVARPDLSVGKFPDLAKARFYQITSYNVRLGQTAKFDALVKAYNAARLRVAPNSSYRVYTVTAGMAATTYLVFTSVEEYGQLDQVAADHKAALAAVNPAEKAELDKYGEIVAREETNHFRVDPVQSYVSKETRAQDPSFWMPK